MPLGLNRSDPNNGGKSFRNGSPVTLPHDFGNDVTLPHDFGNKITLPKNFGNPVTWMPSPSHFGNTIAPPGNFLVQADGVSLILLANGVDALLVS